MQQITQISTEVLRVHPRNQEFFDDIEGKAYEQFKESIKNEGVVTPLIVAPDMTIVSGHQRLKACEDLGIKKVPVIIREDLDDEDEKLKKLLATNFGRTKNDPAKQVKVASEYVELVGMKQGRPDKTGETRQFISQSEIAQSLGISERTLRELLDIDRKLIPQIRELFDNGEITKYTANKVWCRLSPEDQEKFFNEIGRDKISQMTQAQTQKYIDDLKRAEIEKQQLQQDLQREKCKQPEIKVVEKVVDNTDYETIEKLKTELEEKTRVYNIVKDNEEKYKRLMMSYKQDSNDYNKLKREIESLTKQKNSLSRDMATIEELTPFIHNVNKFIKTDLAPTKYTKAFKEAYHIEVIQKNLLDMVNLVEDWCNEIKLELNQGYKNEDIVNVEYKEEV